MSTQTQLIVNNIEIQSPKCIYHKSCGNAADYKTLSGTIDGKKSESWGELAYSNHLYHWNLCGKCFKEESDGLDTNDEEESDEDEDEVEEYECVQCSVEVKTEKDLTITYGCMDMKFCEDCYKTSKDCVKEEEE